MHCNNVDFLIFEDSIITVPDYSFPFHLVQNQYAYHFSSDNGNGI